MVHVPTKFRTSRWNVAGGLLCWHFVGDALEPFYHTKSCNPNQVSMLTPSYVCAKFWSFQAKRLPVSWRIMCRHGNSIPWKLTIFTIKHHQGLKVFLTKFEVDMVNLPQGYGESWGMWNLGLIWLCTAELQQLVVSWQDIEIRCAAMVTPFHENNLHNKASPWY